MRAQSVTVLTRGVSIAAALYTLCYRNILSRKEISELTGTFYQAPYSRSCQVN